MSYYDKEEVTNEVKRDIQEQIKKGEITIISDAERKADRKRKEHEKFQVSVMEIARNSRIIK